MYIIVPHFIFTYPDCAPRFDVEAFAVALIGIILMGTIWSQRGTKDGLMILMTVSLSL